MIFYKQFKAVSSVKTKLTLLLVVLLFAFEAQAQTSGGSGEDSKIFNTGANSGVIDILFDARTLADNIRIYYPPRNENNSTRIYDWTGGTRNEPTPSPWSQSGAKAIKINFGPGPSNNVEIVINEGSNFDPYTWWAYAGTIQGNGQRPIMIDGGAATLMRPPTVVTGTGRIFNPTSTGGGGRSVAGTKGGGASKHNPRRTTSKPQQRKGYVGRIVGPTTSVRLNKAGTTRTAQPNPQGTRSNTSMPKNVLFSGKGSMTTYIRKIPTRSVRRIVLRGGRPH
jgi:hypothetical protein